MQHVQKPLYHGYINDRQAFRNNAVILTHTYKNYIVSCHQEFFTCSVHIYIFINSFDQVKVIGTSPSQHIKLLLFLRCSLLTGHPGKPRLWPRQMSGDEAKGLAANLKVGLADDALCGLIRKCFPEALCYSVTRDCLGGP